MIMLTIWLSIWASFAKTGSSLDNWVQVKSMCFQVNSLSVSQTDAVLKCQEQKASLYSIKNQPELDSLSPLLNRNDQYWTALNLHGNVYKWGDGRNCCPSSWWAPNEPNNNDPCVRLKLRDTKWLLYDMSCTAKYSFICVKEKVKAWTLVNTTEYCSTDLCGVEIMPNCDGQPCEDLCQNSNCNQFAKMANLCVNVKNVSSESDNCIVNLRPNLELYRLDWNC